MISTQIEQELFPLIGKILEAIREPSCLESPEEEGKQQVILLSTLRNQPVSDLHLTWG